MRLISYIIPCYCSEQTIENVINELIYENNKLQGYTYEVIAVNDCSPDNVFCVLGTLAEKNKKIKVISLGKNAGQHSALMAALNYVNGDYIVYLDDDGQCPLNHIYEMIEPLENGWDVSIAKYYQKKQKGIKKVGSDLNAILMNLFLDKPKEIQTSNFWALKRFVVDGMIKYKGPFPSFGGLVLRNSSRIINIEMEERNRIEGTTSYSMKKLVRLLLNNILGFTVKPLRWSIYSGIFFSIMGVLYAMFIVINRLINPEILVGWSSLMVVLLISSGLLLFSVGIVGEYIGRIYMSINNIPQYVIKETLNI